MGCISSKPESHVPERTEQPKCQAFEDSYTVAHESVLSNKIHSQHSEELFPTIKQSHFLEQNGSTLTINRKSNRPRQLNFAEISLWTSNFTSEICGRGGFGNVYLGNIRQRGTSRSSKLVAVKRLDRDNGVQGYNEWLSEVVYLGRFSHPRLITLIGYCIQPNELILVYEYMKNGSLYSYLKSNKPPLTWKQRITIALDSAEGLNYLHSGQEQKIIFRDFQPSNILLDGKFRAKISDFGYAKEGPQGDKTHVTTTILVSYGYTDPEYMRTAHATYKCDVYSFGVVLLELLTGRVAMDPHKPEAEISLLVWAAPHLKHNIHHVLDPALRDVPELSLVDYVNLLLRCIEKNPRLRPSMREIVDYLSKFLLICE